MKKTLNEAAYNRDVTILNYLIAIINRYTSLLNSNGYKFRVQDVKNALDGTFKTIVFQKELKRLAEDCGNKNVVTSFVFSMNNPRLSRIANINCGYLFNLGYEIKNLFPKFFYLADTKYIDIIDNVANFTIDGLERLKYYHTGILN